MADFDGTLWAREQFSAELNRAPLPTWIEGICFHSVAFSMKTARDTPYPQNGRMAKGPDMDKAFSQRQKNFTTRVKEIGGRGWHVTAFENGKLGKGCELRVKGSAHNSWNDSILAIEMCLDGNTAEPQSAGGQRILDTSAWWAAQILTARRLGVNANTVRFHNDEPNAKRRGKTCPGLKVSEADLIERVKRYMTQTVTPAVTPVIALPLEEAFVATPGDTLNFRAEPRGRLKGAIPHGIKVKVIRYQDAWAEVQTPAGYKGWVFAKYLDSAKPEPVLAPLAPEEQKQPVPELLIQPKDFRHSQYGIDWVKRFEGLGPMVNGLTTAYWDINDWAIGHGHNNGSGVLPKVKKGDAITLERAYEILLADVALQVHYLNAYVADPLMQYQIDALIWHIFQQGPGNFRNGKVRPLVNKDENEAAANTIENWPTSNAGLKRRRGVEAARYRGGTPMKW